MSLSGTITMVGAVWGRERRAASCGLSETQNALPEATATDIRRRRTSISDPRRCATDVTAARRRIVAEEKGTCWFRPRSYVVCCSSPASYLRALSPSPASCAEVRKR